MTLPLSLPTIEPERPLPKVVSGSLVLSGDRWFESIQGEGPFQGLPATFLRLHLCNLTCTWCDTPYTWDTSRPEYRSEYDVMTVAQVAEALKGCKAERLVITGGEPLIQQEQLVLLLEHLPQSWAIEIETNGTIAPRPELAARCHFNVSPKLASSGIEFHRRVKPEVLSVFNRVPSAIFKFVVKDSSELPEVTDVLRSFAADPSERVFIQPQAVEVDEQMAILRELAEPVRQLGCRISPRLHTILYGNKRRT